MQFGYADVDITPQPGEELTGYGYYLNRRATGAADPLLARALAMSDGDARAVVVQLDLLALSAQFVDDVRGECERRLGLPGSHLMLHCTHTHSGPAVRVAFGCGRPSEHFLHDLNRHLVSVVEGALENLTEADSMEAFEIPWPKGFAHNRVGGSELDTHVRGVRIVPTAGRPIVLMNYACHPVTMGVNREYSADYPGALIREFNAYGTRALFLTGCSGDINPLINAYKHGMGTSETLRIYGRDLAAVVREGLRQACDWTPGPLRVISEMVPVAYDMPGEDEFAEALAGLKAQVLDSPDDGTLRANIEWHEAMLAAYAQGTMDEISRAEIQVIGCGNVLFAGLAAETFTKLGQMIRDAAPDHLSIIGATTNGVIGYLSDSADVARGGYASSSAAKLYGMPLPTPEAGETWAREGARIVREVIG